jgi:hypothetical protein
LTSAYAANDEPVLRERIFLGDQGGMNIGPSAAGLLAAIPGR